MITIPANPKGDLRKLSLEVRPHVQWAIQHCDALLIAVSGGADSTALAAVIIDHCLRAGSTPHTLTVDHGIRAGSDTEAREVSERMASLGARAQWVSVTLAAEGGPEASARDARRRALVDHARSLGGRVAVFLGHTMDDQAETVLLRLARGSGVGSLKAMSSRDDAGEIVWIRPIIKCRRIETIGVCRQLGLPWIDDPSNAMDGPWRASDGSALRRSAIRECALPSLRSSLGIDPVPALARTAELSAADDEALDQWANQVWTCAWEAMPPQEGMASGMGILKIEHLQQIPEAVQMRVLHRYLSALGAPSYVHLQEARALINHWTGQGPISVPGGTLLRKGKGKQAYLIAMTPADSSLLRQERETPPC